MPSGAPCDVEPKGYSQLEIHCTTPAGSGAEGIAVTVSLVPVHLHRRRGSRSELVGAIVRKFGLRRDVQEEEAGGTPMIRLASRKAPQPGFTESDDSSVFGRAFEPQTLTDRDPIPSGLEPDLDLVAIRIRDVGERTAWTEFASTQQLAAGLLGLPHGLVYI